MQKLTTAAQELLKMQQQEWPMAGKNFADLSNVVTRSVTFDGFDMKLQFNPGRIRSSAAKVDKKTIQNRACFLCGKNRPAAQRELEFGNNYDILVNPFPIFPEHLTIPNKQHTLQLIEPYFTDMLRLATALEGFTIFYNGPRCGASAPDHFHFQAGNTGFMPLDTEIVKIREQHGELVRSGACNVWKVDDSLRKFFVLESDSKEVLGEVFQEFMQAYKPLSDNPDEPDLNLHALYINGMWRVILFLRGKHRPWQFFAEGDDNILLSPASVDFGGVLIMPLEKDFDKVTKADIIDIMQQVSLPKAQFDALDCTNGFFNFAKV